MNLERAKWYLKVADYFENTEFCTFASNECFNYMRYKKFDYSLSIPSLIGPISYINQNFAEQMNNLPIEAMPLQVIDCILSHSEISIKKSALVTWIYKVINAKRSMNVQDWESYYGLFAHVQFEYLTPTEVQIFVKECPSDAIAGALWKAICSRLKKPLLPSPKPGYPQPTIPTINSP